MKDPFFFALGIFVEHLKASFAKEKNHTIDGMTILLLAIVIDLAYFVSLDTQKTQPELLWEEWKPGIHFYLQ